MVVSTANWSNILQNAKEWLCGHVHCAKQKTGLVHSRSKCWTRLVPMVLPSSTNTFQTQTMLSRSLVLSKGSDGHVLMMSCLKDSKSMSLFSQQQATSSILVMTDLRHNQHHMDKVLNNALDDETATVVG